jgi:VWFA-related protein
MKFSARFLAIAFFLGWNLQPGPASQDAVQLRNPIQHEVSVVNIEIPVRVFKGDKFIDNLTISDFEVYEDGKPQQIEAVYLIKKTDIKREEGKKEIKPTVARRFIFLFEMTEFLPEIGKAMDYFFDNVIEPDDSFEVHTPAKSYRMKSHVFEVNPKEKVKDQLRDILRRDIIMGGAEYRNLLRELQASLMEMNWLDYRLYLEQLQILREVDQKNMVAFAEELKKQDGQKHAFLFYQQEVLPQLKPNAFNNVKMRAEAMGAWQSVFDLMDLFELFHRDVKFDVDAIQKAYSDASISIHFLFITKTQMTGSDITERRPSTELIRPSDIIMVEKSEDIYSAFNEVAKATGGISTTSANAAAAFREAVDASENYYLIYYKPQDYRADEQFHKIKVNVRSGNYRVSHRAGYIAK